MKRIVSLLLAIIMIATLAACSGIQGVTKMFNTSSKYVQNIFSGVNDLSEVKNYFDNTLSIDINDLNCFRFYELSHYNLIKSLVQYRETEDSPYKYFIYVNSGVMGTLDSSSVIIPCVVTDLSNADYGHVVSEFGYHIDETGENVNYFIISTSDRRIVRLFDENKQGITMFEYDDNCFITAVNAYESKDSFSEDVLYDLEHHFEDDDCSCIWKTDYLYNSDGCTTQVIYICKGKNSLDHDVNDNYKYIFEYNGKGHRTSENVINLDESDEDNPNNDWWDMHRMYFVIEKDESGLSKKYYRVISEDVYNYTYTINYGSDGLVSSIEQDDTEGYLPGKEE